MKGFKFLFIIVALVALFVACSATAPVQAASTSLTCTSGTATLAGPDDIGAWKVYSIAWTANASGAVYTTDARLAWSGVVERITTDPGSPAPTDNYDITFSDPRGTDPFFGLTQNRDTVNTEDVIFTAPGNIFNATTVVQTVNTNVKFYPWQMVTSGAEQLIVGTAGSGGKGVIRIFVRK